MITVGWMAYDGTSYERSFATWQQARALIVRLEQGYGYLVKDRSVIIDYYQDVEL